MLVMVLSVNFQKNVGNGVELRPQSHSESERLRRW